MPAYNAESYVAEAVESILAQTFRDFEFLIIDDGSTDGSLAILRRYEKQDARIRLISRPNTGYVVALNEMLALAKGELIARMDADDISLPERFALQTRFLASNPGVGAVGGEVEIIDPDGASLCMYGCPTSHDAIDARHMAGHGGAIAHPAAMMRREVLREAGGYRVDYWPAEDLDLFLRLAEVAGLANVEEVVLQYRQHVAATGFKHRQAQVEAARRAVADAYARRGLTLPPALGDVPADTGSRNPWASWGWAALRGGNVRTARKYAVKEAVRRPFSRRSWLLLACAIRGH
jgi:glycosyltransferase involved in cell wall biosynthesis